jgi:hypothetical protein
MCARIEQEAKAVAVAYQAIFSMCVLQKLRESEKTRGSLPSREDMAMLQMMFAQAMSEHITGFEPRNRALRAKHNVCRMMLGQSVHALR